MTPPDPTSIDPEMLQTAHASYERAAARPEFFSSFYKNFFAACPEAPPMFAKTDFDRQHKLLQHAIGLLLIFPKHVQEEPGVLSRLARRHGRKDLNIPPALYGPFVESLILTLRQCDTQFSAPTEAAWRATLAPGVEYMKGKY